MTVDKVVDFTAYSQNTRPDGPHNTLSDELSKAIQNLIEKLRNPDCLDYDQNNPSSPIDAK